MPSYLSWLVFKCSFIYVLLGLVLYCWILPHFLLSITPFRIIEHCIKKRLQWNTSFARKVCKEGEYYEDMMRYLRRNLAVRAKEHFSNFFISLCMIYSLCFKFFFHMVSYSCFSIIKEYVFQLLVSISNKITLLK